MLKIATQLSNQGKEAVKAFLTKYLPHYDASATFEDIEGKLGVSCDANYPCSLTYEPGERHESGDVMTITLRGDDFEYEEVEE